MALQGRAKGAGRRRPQTRAARQLAAQLSEEGRDEGGAEGAGSGVATPSSPPAPSPSALRLPVFAPAESEGAKPKKPRPLATTPVVAPAAEDDLFGSDLFSPAAKRTPSPKPAKSASPEQAPRPGPKKDDVPTIFDDPGGDLFQKVKHKPAKKPKAAAFLDEEDDDIFGAGKSTAVATVSKEPPAESNPSKQDIFQVPMLFIHGTASPFVVSFSYRNVSAHSSQLSPGHDDGMMRSF